MRNTQLLQLIRERIHENNHAIPFSEFMQLALYTPDLGYYQSSREKFGESGDFITAPMISPLFAQCIAAQCQQILSHMGSGDILEFGAGSGIFARDLLLSLEKSNSLPNRYLIIEISESLRAEQAQLFAKDCPQLLSRIEWLPNFPERFDGVIVANEVMDAIPFDCFEITADGVAERRVTLAADQFIWCLKPPRPSLATAVENILNDFPLPEGYQSEVNLTLHDWIQTLGNMLHRGAILLLDYGYGRAEYYHPDRRHGTLMCFHEHRKHDNPLVLAGLQDITAHVDFTTVAESGCDAGLTLAGFTTQAAFLLSLGLLELAEAAALKSEKEKYQQSQGIKKLTLPSQMGEIIKVMGFTKGIDLSLTGFSLQDRRRNL